ncbi:tumor necrosis factor receptor superfamily member 1B isoform X1 [Sciurus carolinensis]|uniref:tumor necrosis factor receptor superfamily member 1B isoform X1 n=1 Tax=Sciurus carolinensis TaxID=30640 RepID=UPI001FB4B3A6|nr:tumor necrosis factor receptor superfamily member 1B isoform X1 [Sciurus carolinensis]
MAPTGLWATLAVGLQLWAAGHAVPAQVARAPYAPAPGSTCRQNEYYQETAQVCCSKCEPGHHAKQLCTQTADTVCVPCEVSTFTQVWNVVDECMSCRSRCEADQVETQACTQKRNRLCTCRPGWYCALKHQDSCRQCLALRRCPPGFGVARPGTATSDVRCAPCPRGTFSNTTSSTDVCKPHRICSLVAIPGSASADAVCEPVSSTLGEAPGTVRTPQPVSTRSQPLEPTPGPSMAPSTSLLLPVQNTDWSSVSLPIGLIVGLTALGLLVIGLVNCVIVAQKKKPSCLQRGAKPHLPADEGQSAPGLEQQHLLTTAPSSSSSSLESSASAADRGASRGPQPQPPGTEEASQSREAQASPRSSESSPGGPGTQVSVTCIVNVCSSSDHGLQWSQASSTAGDPDSSPSGSTRDEQVPFSKEERPFQSQLETPETLPQSSEKPLPLGVPDAGMKLS